MQAGVVDRIAPDIRRILAPNPSVMTGPGTNTYLLGHGDGVIVVDPGPDDPSHLAAIMAALGGMDRVAAILVTHAHKDHCAAAAPLSALTSAPVLAFGDAVSGRSAAMAQLAADGLVGGGEGVDHAFRPDRLVADGEVLSLGTTGLRIIHTPGHMGGHICAAFGDVLLSGDHAMGWASSLISPPDGDMQAYMASLTRLMQERWSLMLPGHGGAVHEVAGRLHELAAHRRVREAEVLATLQHGPASPTQIARQIYQVVPALLLAAERNILAHLIDLEHRKLVSGSGPLSVATIFARTNDQ